MGLGWVGLRGVWCGKALLRTVAAACCPAALQSKGLPLCSSPQPLGSLPPGTASPLPTTSFPAPRRASCSRTTSASWWVWQCLGWLLPGTAPGGGKAHVFMHMVYATPLTRSRQPGEGKKTETPHTQCVCRSTAPTQSTAGSIKMTLPSSGGIGAEQRLFSTPFINKRHMEGLYSLGHTGQRAEAALHI